MIHLLKLFNNPLVKMGINKVSSHFQHKAEKTKVIRAAEIEAAKDTDLARIKSQDNSIKDEILMAWLIAMLTTGWFPQTRENFREWVAIINDLPDSVWYLVIIVFSASFGTKITKSVLDRKKK
ncbi:Protein of unknown function (DUF3154) [uncultured Mediterranean phage uvMED]|nr:Protein of unknown function (DUF3154) [uncultured Mediterranean phage uvMED]